MAVTVSSMILVSKIKNGHIPIKSKIKNGHIPFNLK